MKGLLSVGLSLRLGRDCLLVLALWGCAAETGNNAQNTNFEQNTSRMSTSRSKSCSNGQCTTTIQSQLAAPLEGDSAYRQECQTLHNSALSGSLHSEQSSETDSAPACVDESAESSSRASMGGFRLPAVTSETKMCVFMLPDEQQVSVDLGSVGGGAAEVSAEVESVCNKAGVQCLSDTSSANSVKVTVVAQNTPQKTLVTESQYISICHELTYPQSFSFKFSCVKKQTCSAEEVEYASGEYKQ